MEAPTQRPAEPLTAGIAPIGLPAPQPPADPNAEDVAAMRTWLPYLEFMASQPGAAPSTRLWVRRLRARSGGVG